MANKKMFKKTNDAGDSAHGSYYIVQQMLSPKEA